MALVTSLSCFGQVNYDFFYRPARLELETEISYQWNNEFVFGLRHNEERYCLDPGEAKVLTYVFGQFPLVKDLWLECSYGYGYKHDAEMMLVYKVPCFEVSVGGSTSDFVIAEIKFYLFRQKGQRRYL